MVKLLSPRRLFRSHSKLNGCWGSADSTGGIDVYGRPEIAWEVRPGGMLVQRRKTGKEEVNVIQVRVSTGCHWHDISIGATATFGDLKVLLALVTGLWPREQRLLFKGKEREDSDHLHMVGVQDKDKVVLLEDPAIKERKLKTTTLAQLMGAPCHAFIKV